MALGAKLRNLFLIFESPELRSEASEKGMNKILLRAATAGKLCA